MIIPDWQYPHCGTWCAIHAACSLWGCSFGARPSIVVIFWPGIAEAGTEHERTAVPFTWTVQAPHAAMPQPNLVPVNPSVSRSTHSRGVSSSTSAVRDSPFTSSVICITVPLGLLVVRRFCAFKESG